LSFFFYRATLYRSCAVLLPVCLSVSTEPNRNPKIASWNPRPELTRAWTTSALTRAASRSSISSYSAIMRRRSSLACFSVSSFLFRSFISLSAFRLFAARSAAFFRSNSLIRLSVSSMSIPLSRLNASVSPATWRFEVHSLISSASSRKSSYSLSVVKSSLRLVYLPSAPRPPAKASACGTHCSATRRRTATSFSTLRSSNV